MHNAPAVYVPTEPEGNGLTLPTLLSLLAHGLVIGILIYSYQNMEVETAGSIETVMVSPEQLAEMQGQILANRAAAASAMQAESGSSSSATSTEAFDSSIPPNPSQSNSQQVPVFTRSDDPASRPMLMSEEQHQRLLEQNQEYERNMAEWAARLDESVLEEHDQIDKEKRQQLIEEQKKLGDFRNKQNNPPKIKRPTATDRNIEINTGGSGSAGQNLSLSDDGQSTLSGSMSGQSSGGSPAHSSGASDSEIKALIKKNLISPEGAKGQTVLATLTITVNSSGIITGYNASGSNPKYNKALEDAARVTRKLPIGPDDPKYPTFSIEYIGTTK